MRRRREAATNAYHYSYEHVSLRNSGPAPSEGGARGRQNERSKSREVWARWRSPSRSLGSLRSRREEDDSRVATHDARPLDALDLSTARLSTRVFLHHYSPPRRHLPKLREVVLPAGYRLRGQDQGAVHLLARARRAGRDAGRRHGAACGRRADQPPAQPPGSESRASRRPGAPTARG